MCTSFANDSVHLGRTGENCTDFHRSPQFMSIWTELSSMDYAGDPVALCGTVQNCPEQSDLLMVLKLLKWQGFHPGSPDPKRGELVLFCLACPQPGVNIPSSEDVDLSE